MGCKQWVDLFGRSTDDAELREALASAGIAKVPRIERDETDAAEDITGQGTTLVFTDETLLKRESTVEGSAVFSEVRLILQHPKGKDLYNGPLPFDLQLESSKDALRNRLGTPIEHNDKYRWDRWRMGELVLTVVYAKDLLSLNRVVVGLPRVC